MMCACLTDCVSNLVLMGHKYLSFVKGIKLFDIRINLYFTWLKLHVMEDEMNDGCTSLDQPTHIHI